MSRAALFALALSLVACDSQEPQSLPGPAPQASESLPGAAPEPAERVDHQAELPVSPPADRSTFTPPARGDYPDGPFGESVRRGEALFEDTATHAGSFMGNSLSCSNCHLDDGRRADSAPMWAAWGKCIKPWINTNKTWASHILL